MSQIHQILEGWGNVLKSTIGLLDEETQKLSVDRLLHCNSCDMRTSNSCDTSKYGYHLKTGVRTYGCGCNIAAKTLSRSSQCPLGKW
jgi:hypothetical protein